MFIVDWLNNCVHQVRATNLQELVYKNGQAGVTKASVTVTWDNHDKKHSPLGYESCDEIVVTRQVRMMVVNSAVESYACVLPI